MVVDSEGNANLQAHFDPPLTAKRVKEGSPALLVYAKMRGAIEVDQESRRWEVKDDNG